MQDPLQKGFNVTRGFLDEFKTFISRGSVIDLAVGVVIGAAFNKIVSSLVADIITPPIGALSKGVDFTSLNLVIGGTEQNPVTINYGKFLQSTLDFLIIAFVIFLLIKLINRLRDPAPAAPAAPPEPSAEEKLLTEIRDLLKNQK